MTNNSPPLKNQRKKQKSQKPSKKRKRVQKETKPRKRRKKEKSKRGLRYFSKIVCDKTKEKGRTTYQEVAQELVEEFCDMNNPVDGFVHEEKNVRRRVYDALNVLIALDIIGKDNKNIEWKGYPLDFRQEYDTLKTRRDELNVNIQQQRKRLLQLEKQEYALKKLFSRNEQQPYSNLDESSKVVMPFIIVHTAKNSVIECQMDDHSREAFFNFNQPFEIHDDNEILQRIFLKGFKSKVASMDIAPNSKSIPVNDMESDSDGSSYDEDME